MASIGRHGLYGDHFAPVCRKRLIKLFHIIGLKFRHDEDADFDNFPHGLLRKLYCRIGTIEIDVGFEFFAEVERILKRFDTGRDMQFVEVKFTEGSLFNALYALGDSDDTILDGAFRIQFLHRFLLV